MRTLPRILDLLLATALLLLLAPLLLAIALWLRLRGIRPVLYREPRIGRHGVPFTVHKFATLRTGSPRQPLVAVPGDPRITPPGAVLRHWRLDELPQLHDVLRGAMSLVGPRPLPPEHLAWLPEQTRRRLLQVRPGLVSRTALAYLGEDAVLAGQPDPERAYRERLLPRKVRRELRDLARQQPCQTFAVLWHCLFVVLSRRQRRRSHARARRAIDRPDRPRLRL